jgi:hypothetical protein
MKTLWERICDWAFGLRDATLITYGADRQKALDEIARLTRECEKEMHRTIVNLFFDIGITQGEMRMLNDLCDLMLDVDREAHSISHYGQGVRCGTDSYRRRHLPSWR